MKRFIIGILFTIFMVQPIVASAAEYVVPDRKTIEAHNPGLNIDKLIKDLPKSASVDDPYLWLVNRDNQIEGDIDMTYAYTANGTAYNANIAAPFEALIHGAEEAGYTFYAVSGHRTVAQQEANFNARLNSNMAEGMSYEDAYYMTDQFVAPPYATEHSTGYALDILGYDWDQYGGDLHQAYGQYPSAIWLAKHAQDYGFIIRYLDGKQDITKYEYEPWHIRYVGPEHAAFMMDNGLVLEEYIALIQMRDTVNN